MSGSSTKTQKLAAKAYDRLADVKDKATIAAEINKAKAQDPVTSNNWYVSLNAVAAGMIIAGFAVTMLLLAATTFGAPLLALILLELTAYSLGVLGAGLWLLGATLRDYYFTKNQIIDRNQKIEITAAALTVASATLVLLSFLFTLAAATIVAPIMLGIAAIAGFCSSLAWLAYESTSLFKPKQEMSEITKTWHNRRIVFGISAASLTIIGTIFAAIALAATLGAFTLPFAPIVATFITASFIFAGALSWLINAFSAAKEIKYQREEIVGWGENDIEMDVLNNSTSTGNTLETNKTSTDNTMEWNNNALHESQRGWMINGLYSSTSTSTEKKPSKSKQQQEKEPHHRTQNKF